MHRDVMRRATILAALLVPAAGWADQTVGHLSVGDSVSGKESRPAAPRSDALRVCADPNNLPFTNRQEQGFENDLAELIADELGMDEVKYTWFAQRRGFIRNTLDAGNCDVVMGQPADTEMALTTEPYYRSTYAMVYRKDAEYAPRSLDDPALRKLKIGLIFVGDDGNMPPPWAALRARGISRNVVGYSVYGDYRQPNPPARLIEAVAKGDVDVAIDWGPRAGYFATRQSVELEVQPLASSAREMYQPFEFSIALGVREDDEKFRDELNGILAANRDEIHRLLEDYGVPLLDDEKQHASLIP